MGPAAYEGAARVRARVRVRVRAYEGAEAFFWPRWCDLPG